MLDVVPVLDYREGNGEVLREIKRGKIITITFVTPEGKLFQVLTVICLCTAGHKAIKVSSEGLWSRNETWMNEMLKIPIREV